jgi:hypothetical protein
MLAGGADISINKPRASPLEALELVGIEVDF